MAIADMSKFELPRRALWILVPPIIIMAAGVGLIELSGYPLDHLAVATLQNGHAEAAGRLKFLAVWLLLASAGIASILYCGWSIRALAPATVRLLGTLYLALAIAGVLMVALGGVTGSQRLMDRRVICAAFELVESDARPPPEGEPAGYLNFSRTARDTQSACGETARLYRHMWWLNEIQKYLLFLFVPALALGMVSCLALPARPREADCLLQVRRLNTHLYVTATAMVIGLLFLSALLRWPAFAFAGDWASAYKAHVDAYVLYWGICYSLFIAAFYVPVAIGLTDACERATVPSKPGASPARKAAAGGEAAAAANPASAFIDLVKTLAALFAPAIAGLLGGVLEL